MMFYSSLAVWIQDTNLSLIIFFNYSIQRAIFCNLFEHDSLVICCVLVALTDEEYVFKLPPLLPLLPMSHAKSTSFSFIPIARGVRYQLGNWQKRNSFIHTMRREFASMWVRGTFTLVVKVGIFGEIN
jgi:hypothetical protein